MAQFDYRLKKSFDAEFFFRTVSWQVALDTWIELRVRNHFEANIEVYEDNRLRRVITSEYVAKEWSNYLMENKYNRVEKRLMNEMLQDKFDAMNVIQPEDYLTEETGYKEPQPDITKHNSFDEYGFYGENNAPLPPMKEPSVEKDDVINPKHYKLIPKEAYTKHPEGLEYFDLMEYVLAHHDPYVAHGLGQAFKYLLRAGKKDPLAQDLKKAKWYLDRTIQNIETIEDWEEKYPDFVNGDVK